MPLFDTLVDKYRGPYFENSMVYGKRLRDCSREELIAAVHMVEDLRKDDAKHYQRKFNSLRAGQKKGFIRGLLDRL